MSYDYTVRTTRLIAGRQITQFKLFSILRLSIMDNRVDQIRGDVYRLLTIAKVILNVRSILKLKQNL